MQQQISLERQALARPEAKEHHGAPSGRAALQAALLLDAARDPVSGFGKPEPHKHDLTGELVAALHK